MRYMWLFLAFFVLLPSYNSEQPVEGDAGCLVRVSEISDKTTAQDVILYAAAGSKNCNERIARKGTLILREGAKATVLIMHAYTSNRVDAGFMRLIFDNYNLLMFDFRAHGEFAEDQCSTLGHDEVFDVFAAVDFLRLHRTTKELPIIGYGFSMGAATAIEAQAQDATLFTGLILDCPFDSSAKLVKRGMDKVIGKVRIPFLNLEFELPGRALVEQFAFNEYVQPMVLWLLRFFASMDSSTVKTAPKPIFPEESVKKITIPCFFITCASDATVPVDAVFEDYQNKPGYKRFWITKGARHFGSLFHNPEAYKQLINGFVRQVLSGAYKEEMQQALVISDLKYQEIELKHKELYKHQLPRTFKALFCTDEDKGQL